MLENGFEIVPRFPVTADTPVLVEWRKEGTAAALAASAVLGSNFRLIWPLLLVEMRAGRIGKTVCADAIPVLKAGPFFRSHDDPFPSPFHNRSNRRMASAALESAILPRHLIPSEPSAME